MYVRYYSNGIYTTEEEAAAKYASFTTEELKVMLRVNEAMLIQLEQAFTYRSKQAQPRAIYSFISKPAKEEDIGDAVILLGTCINQKEIKEHLDLYGRGAAISDSIHSVVYYRMNGLLLHCSGGHLVLKSAANDRFSKLPIPCTDEQWELLKSGTVPNEMLSDYYQL